MTDKLICLNRYLFLVTQSPRENVWHLGSVFLTVRALRSSDYIETCDIYQEKQSCRCYVLSGLHKTLSMLPRPQTHKVSPPRPETFNHEVGLDVFEIVDSVGMRLSILTAVCMGTTYDQAWTVRESRDSWFSIITCISASFRTWLDALGWLF